jgi:hypothetical protein
MSDRDDIVNLLNLYALAIDTRQWDFFDLVFTADVQLVFPGSGGEWNELALFKKHFAAAHEPFDTSQHFITNHQVMVKGDKANAISYVFCRHVRNIPTGGGNYWEMGGWYDDVLVRTTAGWRIKRRACNVNWWDGNMAVTETSGVANRYPANIFHREAAAGHIAYLDAVRGK